MGGTGRVLVTGGTGAFGTATTTWLTREGHDVVVFARHEPRRLPKGAVFFQGDVRELDAVRRAMVGCDAVAHLAWTLSGSVTHEQAAPLDLGGTENVLKAMADTSCTRLVFASSVTAYGAHPEHIGRWTEDEELGPAHGLVYEWHKARAEQMIVESGVDAVRVRPTVVVGRHALNAPANTYRQLVIPSLGGKAVIQAVHQDDVGRFFALACSSAATGPVNLSPDDTLTWPEVARLAKRPVLPTSPTVIMATMRGAAKVLPVARSAPDLFDIFLHWPVADTTRLKNDFGFNVAWTSAEAVADQGRASTSYHVLGMREIRRPTRLDRAELFDRADSDADGNSTEVMTADIAGEFDTRFADPSYPEWTCANLAEAFPGPMTPLSLQLTTELLFSSADIVAKLLPLPDDVRANVRTRQLGVFGHRLYHNSSVLRGMVTSVPGQTPEDFEYQICGEPYPENFVRPRPTIRDVIGYARFGVSAGPRLAGLDREVEAVELRARELAASSHENPSLSDERLLARISALWDDTLRSWQIGNLCTFLVSAPTSVITRRHGIAAVMTLHAGTEHLPSARLLRGVRRLTQEARANPIVRSVLEAGVDVQTLDKLQDCAPRYADSVVALLAECGHRGPGETELANMVYSDEPELLLRAVAGSLHHTTSPPWSEPLPGFVAHRLTKAALAAIERRERCRDAVTLTTHQLRLALRAWGSRLVQRGVLDSAFDVFYLTTEQVYSAYSAEGLKAIVQRRRAEHDRLAALEMPVHFEGRLDLNVRHAEATGHLSGTGASPGVARGRVRHMKTPEDVLLEGEILVASATDTGWTPFFGVAAGIVTDIGGLMSHASIVAREFGIPAVVGAEGACAQLIDGQVVEIDGTAGTVTVIEEAPVVAEAASK